MSFYKEITKPTFVVNQSIVRENIFNLLNKIPNNVSFRPHFKTHDNAIIGNIFKEFNLKKIAVSSVEMAIFFAENGFDDICIAFPLNIKEIDKIKSLAREIDLSVCLSNYYAADYLISILKNECSLNVFIEIDTGQNRSGFLCDNYSEINKTLNLIYTNNNLNFIGFLNHNGSTYSAKSIDEIKQLSTKSNDIMRNLKYPYSKFNPIISIGDTPGVCVESDFSGIDELRPGNFVYYDLMQYKLGVCKLENIAAKMYCPVVDINIDRNQIVIYGGAVHFSKEFLTINDKVSYGLLTTIIDKGDVSQKIHGNIISLSQEHGVIELKNKCDISKILIGDIAEIIPVHSCLNANAMKHNTLLV